MAEVSAYIRSRTLIFTMADHTYKLILVGDGGVGKTAFVTRHLIGEFEKKYIATIGVEVHPLGFHTNVGQACFNIWDTAGQEKFGGLRDGYYVRGECAIVMFDLTNKRTLRNAAKWIRDIRKTCGDIPMVLCGNKTEVADRKVAPDDVRAFLAGFPGLQYYEISAKTCYHFEKPFLYLTRQLLGEHVEFQMGPVVVPPTVEVTTAKLQEIKLLTGRLVELLEQLTQ